MLSDEAIIFHCVSLHSNVDDNAGEAERAVGLTGCLGNDGDSEDYKNEDKDEDEDEDKNEDEDEDENEDDDDGDDGDGGGGDGGLSSETRPRPINVFVRKTGSVRLQML
ncbi:unnamed protein product [Angiostrongylus costaricensis]|uniref:ZP domain-containing protein n=1 Tax=Angiostrongylus costaricensis TaxID=334426 RepID=A0A0R3PY99_ANGCS|nr:unnamed protein product [Angiostrongylus costaricensis]